MTRTRETDGDTPAQEAPVGRPSPLDMLNLLVWRIRSKGPLAVFGVIALGIILLRMITS